MSFQKPQIEEFEQCIGNEDYRELASYLDFDFDDFLEGYLLGLAFTGHRWVSEDSEPEPLFSNPGRCISEVVDVESDIWDQLDDETKLQILDDCIGFLMSASDYLEESDSMHDAGSDFHLTRNHHGAGFWDGDWKNGDKLTEIAYGFGGFEIVQYGDSEQLEVIS